VYRIELHTKSSSDVGVVARKGTPTQVATYHALYVRRVGSGRTKHDM